LALAAAGEISRTPVPTATSPDSRTLRRIAPSPFPLGLLRGDSLIFGTCRQSFLFGISDWRSRRAAQYATKPRPSKLACRSRVRLRSRRLEHLALCERPLKPTCDR